jgi:hypothetical protein
MAYRSEARDLDIMAVKWALEHKKFVDLLPVREAVEVEALGIERIKTEVAGSEATKAAFSEVELAQSLAPGFATQANGSGEAAQSALASSEKLRKLISTRLQIEQEYEEAYVLRHSSPGNSHNFVERLTRVVKFLAEDLQEAHQKVTALASGVLMLYAQSFDVPSLEDPDVIDTLVDVARDIARYVEAQDQSDVSRSLVISLAQPMIRNGSEHRLVSENDLLKAINDGIPLYFDLTDELISLKRPRLLQVGLSFSNVLDLGVDPSTHLPIDPGRYQRFSTFRLGATLDLPRKSPGAETVTIYLGAVSVFAGGAPIAICEDNNIQNMDPRRRWSIRLDRSFVYADRLLTRVIDNADYSYIRDLKLHVKLVGSQG